MRAVVTVSILQISTVTCKSRTIPSLKDFGVAWHVVEPKAHSQHLSSVQGNKREVLSCEQSRTPTTH